MLQSLKKWLFIFLKTGTIVTGGLAAIVGVGTLFNLVSYKSKLPSPIILPLPSAEGIGREYLQAVIQKNENYIDDNQDCVHSLLIEHITQYGGTEVRNPSISVQWDSGNGDHQFEVTAIKFEYLDSTKKTWQMGEIRLLTATNVERSNYLPDVLPFRRIHCVGAGI